MIMIIIAGVINLLDATDPKYEPILKLKSQLLYVFIYKDPVYIVKNYYKYLVYFFYSLVLLDVLFRLFKYISIYFNFFYLFCFIFSYIKTQFKL